MCLPSFMSFQVSLTFWVHVTDEKQCEVQNGEITSKSSVCCLEMFIQEVSELSEPNLFNHFAFWLSNLGKSNVQDWGNERDFSKSDQIAYIIHHLKAFYIRNSNFAMNFHFVIRCKKFGLSSLQIFVSWFDKFSAMLFVQRTGLLQTICST